MEWRVDLDLGLSLDQDWRCPIGTFNSIRAASKKDASSQTESQNNS